MLHEFSFHVLDRLPDHDETTRPQPPFFNLPSSRFRLPGGETRQRLESTGALRSSARPGDLSGAMLRCGFSLLSFLKTCPRGRNVRTLCRLCNAHRVPQSLPARETAGQAALIFMFSKMFIFCNFFFGRRPWWQTLSAAYQRRTCISVTLVSDTGLTPRYTSVARDMARAFHGDRRKDRPGRPRQDPATAANSAERMAASKFSRLSW